MLVLRTPTRERPNNVTYLDLSVVDAVSVSGADIYVETSTGHYYEARGTEAEVNHTVSAFMAHIARDR